MIRNLVVFLGSLIAVVVLALIAIANSPESFTRGPESAPKPPPYTATPWPVAQTVDPAERLSEPVTVPTEQTHDAITVTRKTEAPKRVEPVNPCDTRCDLSTVFEDGSRFRITVSPDSIVVDRVGTDGVVLKSATKLVTFDTGSDPLDSTLAANLPALFDEAGH